MAAHNVTQSNAWGNVRNIHRQYKDFYQDFGGLSLVGLFVLLGLIWFAADRFGYVTNVYTEFLSVVVTIAYLDRRAERREVQRQHQEALQRIIREMRSTDASEGGRATDEARERGILTNGALRSARLRGANLQGAWLMHVDLQGANLFRANLQETDLREANLAETDLQQANLKAVKLARANLQHTTLNMANLTEADMENANLAGANMQEADLRGTSLLGVNLIYANLEGVTFNKKTLMPDAGRYQAQAGEFTYDKYWTPDTDMSRYTDPNHPDFWQPEWVKAQQTR